MNETELKQCLDELKTDVHRYTLVHALSSGMSITDALKKANRSKGWFYGLTEDEQKHLFALASELSASPLVKAKEIIDNAVIDAADVKVSGLKSRDERIKQSSSTEILDRVFGKAEQPVSGDFNIVVEIKRNAEHQD